MIFQLLTKSLILLHLLSIPYVNVIADNYHDSTKKPADTLSQVEYISDSLESIRKHLNRPKSLPHSYEVTNAKPREVYFQAYNLLQKANKLSLEHTEKN